MAAKAHTERLPGRGWLKNGNPPGNPGNAPRCGARTRAGTPCRGAAMPNGRCRMHGGPSPGAPKGNQHAYKHGRYSAKAIAQRREISALIRAGRALGRKTVPDTEPDPSLAPFPARSMAN